MFEFLAKLFHFHPELWAAVLGIISGISISQITYSLWMPPMTFLKSMRVMGLIDFILASAVTFITWHYFDPDNDPNGLRLLGCLIVGVVAIALHLFGLAYVKAKWPGIFKQNGTN